MRDRPSRPAGPGRRSRPGARGSATRPGPHRPTPGAGTSGPGSTTRTSAPRPPGRLTGRAIILGVVLVALAMSYVFPLRIYLNQQAEISQLRDGQAAQRAHIDELAAEAARWADQEYVRIQARKRLLFVEPGTVPMITIWDEPAGPEGAGPAAPPPARPEAWWQTLWSSVRAADRGDGGDPSGDLSGDLSGAPGGVPGGGPADPGE